MGTSRRVAPESMSAAANALTNLARAAVTIGVGASVASQAIYDVDGGERAVMFDRFRGVLPVTSGEGTHFVVPFIQNPTIYDVRTRAKSLTGTKDLQQVNLTLRVLCRPDVDKLPKIHQELGQDYDDRVLPSIGNEVLKATVAQFN